MKPLGSLASANGVSYVWKQLGFDFLWLGQLPPSEAMHILWRNLQSCTHKISRVQNVAIFVFSFGVKVLTFTFSHPYFTFNISHCLYFPALTVAHGLHDVVDVAEEHAVVRDLDDVTQLRVRHHRLQFILRYPLPDS